MTFIGSIDTSSATFVVYKAETSFRCIKYQNGNKIEGAEKECFTKEELANFLLSLPASPVIEVHRILNLL